MYIFPMVLIAEVPCGYWLFFFFFSFLDVYFSYGSYSGGPCGSWLFFFFSFVFWMYIFPMVLIAEVPVGPGFFFLFFSFLDVYFSYGSYSGGP